MSDLRPLLDQLYRAVKLAPCCCTERKYWSQLPARICPFHLAIEAYERAFPSVPV